MNQPSCIKSAIRMYIPFKTIKTHSFRKKLSKDKSWESNPFLNTKFYLRYIDRIFNKDSIYSDCFVCEKKLEGMNFLYEGYPYSISRARIFSFDTNVAFLELTVLLENCDYDTIEDINHLLRQSDEKELVSDSENKISVNEISSMLLRGYGKIAIFDHIGESGFTRPEIFTTVVTTDTATAPDHAYKLANGLSSSYRGENTDCQFYSNFSHIQWAVTKRGVCNIGIITNNERNDCFINENWIKYTDTRYIIWYILSLHQKYALFQYLNDIAHKDALDHLGDFQRKIMILNTKYRFSLVSEETSYQKMYELICRVKNLDNEFEDADEEVRRIFEYNEAKSDKNNTIAMTMISILCAFSAVKDLFDLLSSNTDASIFEIIMLMPKSNLILLAVFTLMILSAFAVLLPRHKLQAFCTRIKNKILRFFL